MKTRWKPLEQSVINRIVSSATVLLGYDQNRSLDMAEQFSEFIQQERERLDRERQDILRQHQELENKLAEIDRELEAIKAYEAAKTGKTTTSSRRQGRGGRGRSQAPRGSRRDALLQTIRENPNGLKRGEILERMGLKGDKAGEMSVSNALTALTKANQVSRHEGRYFVQGG
jgi:hypothetical protein